MDCLWKWHSGLSSDLHTHMHAPHMSTHLHKTHTSTHIQIHTCHMKSFLQDRSWETYLGKAALLALLPVSVSLCVFLGQSIRDGNENDLSILFVCLYHLSFLYRQGGNFHPLNLWGRIFLYKCKFLRTPYKCNRYITLYKIQIMHAIPRSYARQHYLRSLFSCT